MQSSKARADRSPRDQIDSGFPIEASGQPIGIGLETYITETVGRTKGVPPNAFRRQFYEAFSPENLHATQISARWRNPATRSGHAVGGGMQ